MSSDRTCSYYSSGAVKAAALMANIRGCCHGGMKMKRQEENREN
jgi:hypothetical protein